MRFFRYHCVQGNMLLTVFIALCVIGVTAFIIKILPPPDPPMLSRHSEAFEQNEIPRYFKYKEKFLMPVQDQGLCASCWSFCLCHMLANALNLASAGSFPHPLSAEYLLDCSTNDGCNVGASPELYYFIPQTLEVGIPLEKDYPYEAVQGACTVGKPGDLRIKIEKHSGVDICTDLKEVPEAQKAAVLEENIKRMKQAIMYYGPIVGTIMVYEDLYEYRADTIYTLAEGSPEVGLHAIMIIGWCEAGVNKEEPGFEGKGYWIIQSSWGTTWASNTGVEAGFGYICMGTNMCQIENRASVGKAVVPEFLEDAILKASLPDAEEVSYRSYESYSHDPERHNFLAKMGAAKGL